MTSEITLPWDFSAPPKKGEPLIPNLPTPEGKAMGKKIARLTKIGLERMYKKFPDAPKPCNDCAFIEGTTPNGCADTMADALKCAVEKVPFMCHKILKDGEPQRLCMGWVAATDAMEVLERVKAIEVALK